MLKGRKKKGRLPAKKRRRKRGGIVKKRPAGQKDSIFVKQIWGGDKRRIEAGAGAETVSFRMKSTISMKKKERGAHWRI